MALLTCLSMTTASPKLLHRLPARATRCPIRYTQPATQKLIIKAKTTCACPLPRVNESLFILNPSLLVHFFFIFLLRHTKYKPPHKSSFPPGALCEYFFSYPLMFCRVLCFILLFLGDRTHEGA